MLIDTEAAKGAKSRADDIPPGTVRINLDKIELRHMFGATATLTADNEFTVTYGVSAADRSTMLAVILSVSQRRLARAAKVSTRSIPGDEVAATSMSDVHVRELFDAASALAEDDRKQAASDDEVVAWIGKQVGERGLTLVADELKYDTANLAKVVARKRSVSRRLQGRVRGIIYASNPCS